MLSSAIDYYDSDPMYMVIPGVAIFITVLAFNLFGTACVTRWTRRAPAELPYRKVTRGTCTGSLI
ncbi:hypothetical protein STENM36S_04613 [Streptomyces tendae]